jgi:hypothetical protein
MGTAGSYGWRRDGEPDAGASEELDYDAKGLRLRVTAPGFTREGKVSWPRMVEWLRPGVNRARRHVFERASYASASYQSFQDRFDVTGQHALHAAAVREIGAIRAAAVAAIIDAALEAHQQPRPSLAPARRRVPAEPAPRPDTDALISVELGLTDADKTILERLTQFMAVLPSTGHQEVPVPLSQLKPGDVLRHAGFALAPFVLREPPQDHGDHVTLTGEVINGRAGGHVITWNYHKNGEGNPRVYTLPLPGSLDEIVHPPGKPTPRAATFGDTTQPPRSNDVARETSTAGDAADSTRQATTPSAAADGTPAAERIPLIPARTSGRGEQPLGGQRSRRPAREEDPVPEKAANLAGAPPATASDTELDRAFADVLDVLAAHRPSPPAGPAAASRHQAAPAADAFADVWAAFADLRQALGLPGHDGGLGANPILLRRADPRDHAVLRPLDDAIAEAQASLGWCQHTPEWRRIISVRDAARALFTAVRDAAADYWAEVGRDIRVRGFIRTVTARACRTASHAARLLAGKLDQIGMHATLAARAMWRLHQVTAEYSRRLIAHQPLGSHLRDAKQVISCLRSQAPHPGTPSRAPGQERAPASGAPATSPAALARAAFPGPVTDGAHLQNQNPQTGMRVTSSHAPHPSRPARR